MSYRHACGSLLAAVVVVAVDDRVVNKHKYL